MSYQFEVILVLASVGAACAVPGVFLVLRRVALVADAISHVLLFGIVLAYFVTRDLASPWLFFGATASGVLTVALVELLRRSDRVAEDAAIGLVFPALFAIGTLLASMFLRSTHLDVDSVLMGFGLNSDAIHSPNEHYGLFNFYKGIETIPYYYMYYRELKG